MTKFCKDCQYLSWSGLLCQSPTHGVDPVNGGFKGHFASIVRSPKAHNFYPDVDVCGPEGNHFKQKKVNHPWWKCWSNK